MKKAIEMMQKIQVAIGGFFLCIFLLTVVFQMLSRYIGMRLPGRKMCLCIRLSGLYSWGLAPWFTRRGILPLRPSAIC